VGGFVGEFEKFCCSTGFSTWGDHYDKMAALFKVDTKVVELDDQ
jgi:hypothetical protein